VNETVADRTDSRRFFLGLTAIALVALGIRVAAAIWYQDHTGLWGDAFWYSGVGNLISDGKGFISPAGLAAFGEEWPTAAHPPLYALYLSIVGHVDQGLLAQRLWSTLPGVGTVVLLGVLGREVASERAGLIAAAIGAISVSLFAQDVLVMSEGLYGCMIVLTVWFAYRYVRRPDLVRAGLLSGAIALAALTRAEGALLFLILLVPLALRAKQLSSARRWACIGVGALVAAVLFAPWLAYNNVNRFDSPVFLSTGLGGLVGSSNCPPVYDGPAIGGWGGICAKGVKVTVREDETKQDDKLLDAGLDYARAHADRLPVVIPFRLLRTFGFYKPVKVTAGDLLLMEGSSRWGARLAVLQYFLLLAAGIAGFVLLVRRKVTVLPFVAPVVTVAVITIIGYGTIRFRIALDVLLPVLAAAALDAAWTRFSARSRRSERLQRAENGDRVGVLTAER
jgi:4-amino-4-deoxy-L-arabinose transferase-like glycosyltransferase